jgi:hypothetical protein
VRSALFALLALGAFAGCTIHDPSEPGLLVAATVDEDATLPALDVDGTRLHVELRGPRGWPGRSSPITASSSSTSVGRDCRAGTEPDEISMQAFHRSHSPVAFRQMNVATHTANVTKRMEDQ